MKKPGKNVFVQTEHELIVYGISRRKKNSMLRQLWPKKHFKPTEMTQDFIDLNLTFVISIRSIRLGNYKGLQVKKLQLNYIVNHWLMAFLYYSGRIERKGKRCSV